MVETATNDIAGICVLCKPLTNSSAHPKHVNNFGGELFLFLFLFCVSSWLLRIPTSSWNNYPKCANNFSGVSQLVFHVSSSHFYTRPFETIFNYSRYIATNPSNAEFPLEVVKTLFCIEENIVKPLWHLEGKHVRLKNLYKKAWRLLNIQGTSFQAPNCLTTGNLESLPLNVVNGTSQKTCYPVSLASEKKSCQFFSSGSSEVFVTTKLYSSDLWWRK